MNIHAGHRRMLLAVLSTAALVTAGGVAAAGSQPVRLTAEGQAAARAAVLQRVDFGGASGWTGGATKPGQSSDKLCAGFQPKETDLVLNGQAEAKWKHASGLQFDSYADVLQTPAMVRLDWQRSVLSPKFLPCVRTALVRDLPATAHIVSITQVSFPPLTAETRRYRIVIDIKEGQTTIRMMSDLLMIGAGRTEIMLTAIAPFAAAPAVNLAELRIAHLLLARSVNVG
jgi:hypothetical protein